MKRNPLKRNETTRHRFGTTLAYVRWFDSALVKDDYCRAEDVTGYMENESCGILIRQNDNEVVIALDRCLDTQQLRLVLCIPRANVREFREIRV
jgi:hypothetical protein